MSKELTVRASLLMALLAVAAPASAQRLSADVVPERYTLWFAPNLEAATCRGEETIRVQLREPATTITLHAAGLTRRPIPLQAGFGERRRLY